MLSTLASAWREYDEAAMDLARKGLKGEIGDPLPNLMTSEAVNLINTDPEAFQARVRSCAYALAMEDVAIRNHEPKEED